MKNHALFFVIASLAICASALPSEPSTNDVVPETEETQMFPRGEWLKSFKIYKSKHQIHDEAARASGECVSKFPCYYRSKVAWTQPFLKNYMLGGPIKMGITAIKGLTAYVCPVRRGGQAVTKWIKFDDKEALDEFKKLQGNAFNPETRLGPRGPLAKCRPGKPDWRKLKCWMSAWVLAGGRFEVTHNPHVADVPSSKYSFDQKKHSHHCMHCHPGTNCYKPSWHLRRL
jgi:hypothetical protein